MWLASGEEAHDHLLEGQRFCWYETGDTFSKDPRTTSFNREHPFCVLAEIPYCTVSVPHVFISHSPCQALGQVLLTQTNQRVLV